MIVMMAIVVMVMVMIVALVRENRLLLHHSDFSVGMITYLSFDFMKMKRTKAQSMKHLAEQGKCDH